MTDPDYPTNDGQSDAEIAAEIAAAGGGGEAAARRAPDPQGEGAPSDDGETAALRAETAALREQMLRLAADLENTRRRAEREKADISRYAIANFARDLLSVADNFARALGAAPADDAPVPPDAFANLLTGLRMTDKDLHAALQRHGVREIIPVGEKFDPNLHQAVAQAPSPHPAGFVANVAQSGFTIGDRVLRAAMVVVSTGPAASGAVDSAARDAAALRDDGPEPALNRKV